MPNISKTFGVCRYFAYAYFACAKIIKHAMNKMGDVWAMRLIQLFEFRNLFFHHCRLSPSKSDTIDTMKRNRLTQYSFTWWNWLKSNQWWFSYFMVRHFFVVDTCIERRLIQITSIPMWLCLARTSPRLNLAFASPHPNLALTFFCWYQSIFKITL